MSDLRKLKAAGSAVVARTPTITDVYVDMMSRSPAFQFFPADWLGSPKITLMSPAEEGGYIRLLAYCWSDPDCSIPDNDAELAQLSRLGEAWLKGSSTRLRECFVQHPRKPGRLVNLRLLKERARQAEWRNKCRLGGIQSGKTRALSVKGSSRVVEVKANRTVEVNANSSSSSSSSKKKEDIDRNGHAQSFEQFWSAFPRKEGKKDCQKWWSKHQPDETLLTRMLSNIEEAKQTAQWKDQRGKFVPMPATWLNGERWNDEIQSAETVKRPAHQVVL